MKKIIVLSWLLVGLAAAFMKYTLHGYVGVSLEPVTLPEGKE